MMKNRRIFDIQKQFFLRLLSTKSGRAVVAFNKWRQLPQIDDVEKRQRANAFERRLGDIYQKLLRSTFKPLN